MAKKQTSRKNVHRPDPVIPACGTPAVLQLAMSAMLGCMLVLLVPTQFLARPAAALSSSTAEQPAGAIGPESLYVRLRRHSKSGYIIEADLKTSKAGHAAGSAGNKATAKAGSPGRQGKAKATMPTEAAVNCVGAWTPATCQSDCGNRTYAIKTPVSGTGTPCPSANGATEKCSPGTGACEANVACVGSWYPATCNSDCDDLVYLIETRASGTGTPCPSADTATEKCSPGTGACPEARVHCVGSWSPATCQSDCGDRTYAIKTPVSGTGYPCSAADGATEKCSPGTGACPGT